MKSPSGASGAADCGAGAADCGGGDAGQAAAHQAAPAQSQTRANFKAASPDPQAAGSASAALSAQS